MELWVLGNVSGKDGITTELESGKDERDEDVPTEDSSSDEKGSTAEKVGEEDGKRSEDVGEDDVNSELLLGIMGNGRLNDDDDNDSTMLLDTADDVEKVEEVDDMAELVLIEADGTGDVDGDCTWKLSLLEVDSPVDDDDDEDSAEGAMALVEKSSKRDEAEETVS